MLVANLLQELMPPDDFQRHCQNIKSVIRLLIDVQPFDVSCLWKNDPLSLCFSSLCDVTLPDLRDAAANKAMVRTIPVTIGNAVAVPSSFIPA